jgi:hypothetical protein
LLGADPDKAAVAGNAKARHFALISYGTDGYIDLLVNTTDPYEGQVLLRPNVVLLEVKAEGPWSIDVTGQ